MHSTISRLTLNNNSTNPPIGLLKTLAFETPADIKRYLQGLAEPLTDPVLIKTLSKLYVILTRYQMDQDEPEIFKLFEKKGISYDKDYLNQEFILATKASEQDGALRLLAAGADINVQDERGRTALIYAYANQLYNLVSAIYSKKPDPSTVFSKIDLYSYVSNRGIFYEDMEVIHSLDPRPGSESYEGSLINLACLLRDADLLSITLHFMEFHFKETGEVCLPMHIRLNLDQMLEYLKDRHYSSGRHPYQVFETNRHHYYTYPVFSLLNDFIKKHTFQTDSQLLQLSSSSAKYIDQDTDLKVLNRLSQKGAQSDPSLLKQLDSWIKKPSGPSQFSPALVQDILKIVIQIEYQQHDSEYTYSTMIIDKIIREHLFAALSHWPISKKVSDDIKQKRLPIHLAIAYQSVKLCNKLLSIAPYSQTHFIEPYHEYGSGVTKAEKKTFEERLESKDTAINTLIKSQSEVADFCDYAIYIQKRKTGLSNHNQKSREESFQWVSTAMESIISAPSATHQRLHATFIATIEGIIKRDAAIRIPFTNIALETENHAEILRGILKQQSLEKTTEAAIQKLIALYQQYKALSKQVEEVEIWRSEILKFAKTNHPYKGPKEEKAEEEIGYNTSPLELDPNGLFKLIIKNSECYGELYSSYSYIKSFYLRIPGEINRINPNLRLDTPHKYKSIYKAFDALSESFEKWKTYTNIDNKKDLIPAIYQNIIDFIYLKSAVRIRMKPNPVDGMDEITVINHLMIVLSLKFDPIAQELMMAPYTIQKMIKPFCKTLVETKEADLYDYQIYIEKREENSNDEKGKIRRSIFNTIISLFETCSKQFDSKSLKELMDKLKEGSQSTQAPRLLNIGIGSQNHTDILQGILKRIGDDPKTQEANIRKMYETYQKMQPGEAPSMAQSLFPK